MPRTINRQLHHVGNLGDVIKHAALVEIASRLARGAPRVSYVETNAFQLHAPLPDLARWERELDALSSRHAGYARYEALARAALARTGNYRCSAGLVLDALGDRCARAVLAESNAATRAELGAQLALEGKTARLVDEAASIDRDPIDLAGDALLVHVDPFRLTADIWAAIAPSLASMFARATAGAMIVYRFSRNASAPWPALPSPSPRTPVSVAEMRGGPHQVAAYASTEIADDVRAACASLGWTETTRS